MAVAAMVNRRRDEIAQYALVGNKVSDCPDQRNSPR